MALILTLVPSPPPHHKGKARKGTANQQSRAEPDKSNPPRLRRGRGVAKPEVGLLMSTLTLKQRSVLPGFGLSLGYTVVYLSLIVLIPLSGALFEDRNAHAKSNLSLRSPDPEVVAAFKLTFGLSLVAALVNARLRAARGLGAGALSLPR